MAAPKAVNWSATTEGDSWVYAFRFVTAGDHEDTLRRAETIANWPDRQRDDPEVVQAAYAAIREGVERRVDELDGPPTHGALTLGKDGAAEGVTEPPDPVETIDSLRAERDDLQERYDALLGTLQQAVAEHAPAEVAVDA